MMRNNDIYEIFREGFSPEYFKRLDDSCNLNMYVGKNKDGHYTFEYSGNFIPTRVMSSELIVVSQYKQPDRYTICFSLVSDELLESFSIFCQDLVDSVRGIEDMNEGYRIICERFFSWKKLFKPNKAILADSELMGLLGELMFLKDKLLPFLGELDAIESWIGPEKTHKDFSFRDTWVEVKSVSSGKDAVRISSVEQLDGSNKGYLVVYRFERMSNTYNGINLNMLVNDILSMINRTYCKDLFMTKLDLNGYHSSPEYNDKVYNLTNVTAYVVGEGFPRLTREQLPTAISHVQYELLTSEIEQFKSERPWK
ncbi:MAG: PD-(D/E)XK motif protein [Prevotella sp.]|nr:PD-(D/E)XK motif protein [Prevotella sp.]